MGQTSSSIKKKAFSQPLNIPKTPLTMSGEEIRKNITKTVEKIC